MTTLDTPVPETPAAETSEKLGGVDLDELTERVYQRWLDELRRERERSGMQWW